jgi:hypothetical protein
MLPLLTFLKNLFSILYKVPAAITILKAIMDILGSETVKAVLEAIHDAVTKSKTTDTPIDTLPTQERQRFIERLRLRVGQRLLGLSDSQYAAAMLAFGPADEAQSA